jgi:hypothetical protein
MFLKVQDEEKKIRTKVSARVTPLLEKVFGTLDRSFEIRRLRIS